MTVNMIIHLAGGLLHVKLQSFAPQFVPVALMVAGLARVEKSCVCFPFSYPAKPLCLLRQNHLSTGGAISIAKGLATNQTLKTLNLMNQNHKISEEALENFITMFQTNLALTKLMWKVDSRRTWEVSKLITRNVEIGRRKAAGASIQDLLPAKLREDADASGSHSQPVQSPPASAAVPATKADAEPAELAQTPPEATTARSGPEEQAQELLRLQYPAML